jgi:hypothetical protein
MIFSHSLVVRVLLLLEAEVLRVCYTLYEEKTHERSRNPTEACTIDYY